MASQPFESDHGTPKTKSLRQFCAVCQSVQNLKRCSQCKTTFYCCVDHQKADWSLHKKVCTAAKRNRNESIEIESNESRSCCGRGDHESQYPLSGSTPLPTNSTAISYSQNHEGFSQRDEEEIQSEIESILDFRSLNTANNINTRSLESDSKKCKEIFAELKDSNVHNYMGPSDGFDLGEQSDDNIDQHFEVQEFRNGTDPLPEVSNPLNLPSEGSSLESQEVIGRENENENSGIVSENSSSLNNVVNVTDSQQAVNETDIACHTSSETETPLDSRPLRKMKFPKPTSYEYEELAEFISLRLINLGYCILDELFEDDHIAGIQTELSNSDAKHINNQNRQTNSESKCNPSTDHKRWIEEGEEGMSFTSKAMLVLDSIMNIINPSLRKHSHIKGRTKFMYSCDPGNGSFHSRHIDNPNNDGRRIKCVLYVDKDWDLETDGGLLRIVRPHLDKPIDIPPKANRLVFYWSDKRNPYEVHPIYRKRFSLTAWYFDEKEKEAAKLEELKTEAEQITARIDELEEKRKQMEEATIRQAVENKAMAAVRSLSEEELQALSVLVYNHPQPRQAMTAIGIAPSIQDALFLYLGNL